ncbi:hypothetical protein V6N12_055082 [Hibiscus sabdariffa]|uniref:Uncharacterized protein n=1 Tax=Hibiscus sabdariffa TaxID=183260 RepID=A0ABR2ALQ5_9ROSI
MDEDVVGYSEYIHEWMVENWSLLVKRLFVECLIDHKDKKMAWFFLSLLFLEARFHLSMHSFVYEILLHNRVASR